MKLRLSTGIYSWKFKLLHDSWHWCIGVSTINMGSFYFWSRSFYGFYNHINNPYQVVDGGASLFNRILPRLRQGDVLTITVDCTKRIIMFEANNGKQDVIRDLPPGDLYPVIGTYCGQNFHATLIWMR
jgi:hypothetical protein